MDDLAGGVGFILFVLVFLIGTYSRVWEETYDLLPAGAGALQVGYS